MEEAKDHLQDKRFKSKGAPTPARTPSHRPLFSGSMPALLLTSSSYHLLLTTYFLLLTSYYLLLTAYRLLLTAYFSLPSSINLSTSLSTDKIIRQVAVQKTGLVIQ